MFSSREAEPVVGKRLRTPTGAPYPSYSASHECDYNTEAYAFIIMWSLLNYFIILIFAILLITWHDMYHRSIQIRKNILEIIRQVNFETQDGLDLLDSAIANIQDEINRRQEFVRTLHEYGIYLM